MAAAALTFAERGLAAPTAAISKAAEISEGSLFTYFATKDELLNALYREIKLNLAEAMMSEFSRHTDVRSKLEHIWNSFVNWGMENPAQRRVLAQLQVSDKLTRETRAVGSAPFAEVQVMLRGAIEQGVVRDLPHEVLTATIDAMASATMELIATHPNEADRYRSLGFEVMWNGIRIE
ncbi:TetR/AcrR family transcriptional regulator [Paludibaculum fermentans]|uniref:TetR/AcrR family transcriptional regulator n=1 Tax=Paludibaculum fermentans TaxID=1473598 RepID=A0A7S7SLS3_PALFE|nr:TetR/AcrR family transcriptional regulator [Paludibaculum fermentans]QOY88345.1 TetR/AcrR family transcriptional regulator [Paludibaculum fermentans]